MTDPCAAENPAGAIRWPAGVDASALVGWMDSVGLGRGPIEDVAPIGGGTQNVMCRLRRDGRTYVLRRGPRHLRARSNEALLREIQVLHALDGTGVPHPRLVAACRDETVLDGAVFYLMEPVDGVNAAVELPARAVDDPAVRHHMGLALVDALTTLGAVDHRAVGLGEFGRPAGFLERQVPRWLAELESYSALAGYPGPRLPGVDRVASWLTDHRPTTWTPGLMHGDYHLANVMFAPDAPRVIAIVDWEMATVGDPLLDLGWVLATWPEPGSRTDLLDSPLAAAGDLPTGEELVARYARQSARDLTAIGWYAVLACFKLGVLLEGTHARACAGKATRAVGERLHASAVALFDRAQRLLASA